VRASRMECHIPSSGESSKGYTHKNKLLTLNDSILLTPPEKVATISPFGRSMREQA